MADLGAADAASSGASRNPVVSLFKRIGDVSFVYIK